MDINTKKVQDISKWAIERKADDLATIDVSRKSSFTDIFIICSANGSTHAKAIAKHILEQAKYENYQLLGKEGFDNGQWILLDFGDTIIHIFDEPIRNRYQLEDLWHKTMNINNIEG